MKITLKAARVNLGITQKKAAEILKISKETLSNWERQKTYPDANHIKNIEKLYNISYDDIIFSPQNYI